MITKSFKQTEEHPSILVIEDDPLLNKLIGKALRRDGFTAEMVCSAEEGLLKLQDGTDRLVLLDYMLPDKNGKQFVLELKKVNSSIPFIIMTGYGDQNLAVEMMKLGARDYIVKDTDFIDRLPQTVRRVVKELNIERRLAMVEQDKLRLEQQLWQVQKMEAIGLLAGSIAHDFNNLLSAILGYSDLVLEEVDESSIVFERLQQVQQATLRAARLTHQLLLFSRKQEISKKPLLLNDIIEDMHKMLQRLLRENIRIMIRPDQQLWYVEADLGNIEQVIMNLAVNGRDAMAGGGTLTITTENRNLSENDCRTQPDANAGNYVMLSVSDTGIGMNEETMDHIFEPMYTTKEQGKGTGLGLSIVYGIVRQHGGWIDASSKKGIGTTFNIYLPAIEHFEEVEKKHAPARLSEFSGSGQHVLVVEDDDDMREWSIIALRENGYVVSEARSAEEAMDIFTEHEDAIEMMISDVVMPGNTGYHLAEQFVSRKPSGKIILSSGYNEEINQKRDNEQIEHRFLEKPYTMMELLSAVKEVFEER